MPRKTPIRKEDIYEIRSLSSCRLSPRGDRLVFVVSQPDRKALKNLSHLWLLDVSSDRVGPEALRQFTSGPHSETNPRWSPDGKRLAFISTRSGKSELWTIPVDGGEARQLTRLEGSVSGFQWSPNGRKLIAAFTPQDTEAKEREAKKKRGEPGVEAPRVREIRRLFYKLDGTGILPTNRTHLWMVDAESGRARQLTRDDRYDESEPCYSPDGRWIYFVSNRSEDPDRLTQRVDVWRMPARGGAIQKVRSFDGPSYDISLSPDGRWLAYLGTPDPEAPWNQYHTRLWLIPSRGGRPVCLTASLDRAMGNSTITDTAGVGGSAAPVWSPDSQMVYFLVTNSGNTEVWRVELKERKPEPVVNQPGMAIDFAVDFERRWIHALWGEVTNPGEVRSFPLPGPPDSGRGSRRSSPRDSGSGAHDPEPRSVLQRSSFNAEWLARREVAVPEEIWFTGKRNHRLQGWILRPPRRRAGTRPGMLYIHGGPATQYGRTFFHEFQFLAASGIVVFYSNPRGGTGYSEKHLNSIVGKWGTIDYDDLMVFTDTVLRHMRGELDRRRLAVGGGSYGGYMTNWIIGHTDRFACAVTSRSISNLMSFVGSSDFGYAWPRQFLAGIPWDDPQRYLRMSPLTYLKNMKTPTLIEHQEEDHRCPVEQAEQLWAALKLKGVPVEFVRYPGEPHGMSRGGRPDRRIDRLERIVKWLERWIGKRR